MSTNARDVAGPASLMRLRGLDVEFVESLTPDRNASGTIIELNPQARYAGTALLHKYGNGTFCKFRVSAPKGLTGVYALVVDEAIRYIGECEDLSRRFNSHYGNISPQDCYKGGQPTNCKINRRVLEMSKAAGRVDLYFLATPQRETVEKQLIAIYSPPWNG